MLFVENQNEIEKIKLFHQISSVNIKLLIHHFDENFFFFALAHLICHEKCSNFYHN